MCQNVGLSFLYHTLKWFCDLFSDSRISQSRAIRSQIQKNRGICDIHGTDFLSFESTSNLTDFPSSIYDIKSAAQPFDTIHDILRSLSLAKFLLKDRNASIWRIENREVKPLWRGGKEGLSNLKFFMAEILRIFSSIWKNPPEWKNTGNRDWWVSPISIDALSPNGPRALAKVPVCSFRDFVVIHTKRIDITARYVGIHGRNFHIWVSSTPTAFKIRTRLDTLAEAQNIMSDGN